MEEVYVVKASVTMFLEADSLADAEEQAASLLEEVAFDFDIESVTK